MGGNKEDKGEFNASKGFDKLGVTSLYNPHIGDNIVGDEYYEKVCRNFKVYKDYLEKKNEQLRQANSRKELISPKNTSKQKKSLTGGCLTGMIKESQDEIMELS